METPTVIPSEKIAANEEARMSAQLDQLNKRLLIALGLSDDSAQIVIDHIDELRIDAGRLRTEIVCLKQDLKDATMGKCVCTDCDREVFNAWRDGDGNHCLTCLAKERDSIRERIAAVHQLGQVYKPPADWDYPGQGGHPPIEAYEKHDLASY